MQNIMVCHSLGTFTFHFKTINGKIEKECGTHPLMPSTINVSSTSRLQSLAKIKSRNLIKTQPLILIRLGKRKHKTRVWVYGQPV
jgi:hypothetical protein